MPICKNLKSGSSPDSENLPIESIVNVRNENVAMINVGCHKSFISNYCIFLILKENTLIFMKIIAPI